MRRTIHFPRLPTLVLCLVSFGNAANLDISSFIESVLRKQPRLSEDSIDLSLARERVSGLYRQAVLPRFELSTAFGPAPGFRYVTDSVGDTTGREFAWWPWGPYFGTELEVAQPLNVERFRAGLRAARAGVRVESARLQEKRIGEVKEGLEYWFGLQFANRMVRLLEDAEHRLDSVQTELQNRIDRQEDGASLDDLLNLKIGRFTLEKGMAEARLGRERARGALAFFLRLPSVDSLHLQDSLLDPLPELPPLDSLLAGFHPPELEQLRAGLEAKRALVEVERGALGPDIFVFGKFSYTKAWVANRDERNRDVLVTDPINSVSGAFGLALRWRLNFWAQQSSVRRTELDWRALKRKEVYARDGLELYLKDAWLRYQALGEKAQGAKRAIESCEALLESILSGMELDPDRAKELLGPYKTWLDLQNQYYDLTYQRNLATVEVLAKTGWLLEPDQAILE